MKAIIEILLERQQLSAAAFGDRYSLPVLIHRLKKPDGISLSAETQFAVRASGTAGLVGGVALSMGLDNAKAHMHLARAMGSLGDHAPQAIADGSIVVFRSIKPPGAKGMSIGRANECTYFLPFPKISKVHAYLKEQAGRWTLVDAGSRNGTQMNGTPVPADAPVIITDGASLQISQCQFLFYTPAGFYRILGEG